MTDPKTLQPLFRCRGSDIKDPDNVLAELGWHPRAIERMNATTPLRRGVATGVYPFTSNRKSARRVAARRTPVIIQEDGQRLQPDDGNNCTPDEEETIEGQEEEETVEGQEEEETVEGQGEKEPIVAADEGESARKEDMDGNERYEEDEDETLDEIELELSPGAEVVDKSSSGIPRIRKRQHEDASRPRSKKKKPRRLPLSELVTTSQKSGDDPTSQIEADSLSWKRIIVQRKKPKHRGRGRRFFENIDMTDFHQPKSQPNQRPSRSTRSYRDGFEGQEAAPTYLYMKIRRSKHKPITGNVTLRFPSLTIVAEKASLIDIEIMQTRPVKKRKKRAEPSEAINVPGDRGQSREHTFIDPAQLHTPASTNNQRPAFPQTPISKNVRNEKKHSARDNPIAKMKKIDIRISQELTSVSVPRRSPSSSGSDDEDDKESASEQGSIVSREAEPEDGGSSQEGGEAVPTPDIHFRRDSPESPEEQDGEPEPEQIVPQHLVQSHASIFTPQPVTEDDVDAEIQNGSWRPQVPDRHRMRLEAGEIFESPTRRSSSFLKAPVRPHRNCSRQVGSISDHTIFAQARVAPGSPILGESQETQLINSTSPALGQSREILETQIPEEGGRVSQISFVPVESHFSSANRQLNQPLKKPPSSHTKSSPACRQSERVHEVDQLAQIIPSLGFHNAVSPQRAQSQRLPGLMRQTSSQPSKALKDLTRSTSRMMGTRPAGTRRTSRFEPHKPPFKKPGTQSSSGVFGG